MTVDKLIIAVPARLESLRLPRKVLIDIAKYCAVKFAMKDKETFFNSINNPSNYEIIPTNKSCYGDEKNLITARSQDREKSPTYSYNVKTGEKTCSHDGPREELYGCSTRRNGEWESP